MRVLISEIRVFEELRELCSFERELNLPVARIIELLKVRQMTKGFNFQIQLGIVRGRFK